MHPRGYRHEAWQYLWGIPERLTVYYKSKFFHVGSYGLDAERALITHKILFYGNQNESRTEVNSDWNATICQLDSLMDWNTQKCQSNTFSLAAFQKSDTAVTLCNYKGRLQSIYHCQAGQTQQDKILIKGASDWKPKPPTELNRAFLRSQCWTR